MAIACLLKIIPRDNVAIFCGRKDSANKILSRIIELNSRGYDVSGLKNRSDLNEISKISNLLAKNYGTDEPLYQAAQLGVFAHHAGVSDGIKNSVKFALKESMITNVICTFTLAQGVNLPIKYLVISSIYQAGEQIKVRDFHNLIGRTARSGMFTEGTIIFSDPFAYNTDRWKWDQYKRLLDPNNSESCTSIILDIVRQHSVRNKPPCCFYNAALMRYTDFENFQESKKKFLSNPNQDPEIIRLFKHVFNILSRIENYIALNSICEIFKSNGTVGEEDDGDNLLEIIESLQKLSQKLKYGLPEQTDILCMN